MGKKKKKKKQTDFALSPSLILLLIIDKFRATSLQVDNTEKSIKKKKINGPFIVIL